MRVVALPAVLFLLAVSASWGSGAGTAAVALTVSNGRKPPPSHVRTRWRATVATLPANAATGENQAVSISSISCVSPGNCTAVGSYYGNADDQEGLLLTEKAGHWQRGIEAVLPTDAASDPQVGLTSVSCASAGNCTAVGNYTNSGGIYSEASGVLLTEKAGHWATGVERNWPGLHSVSCASAGNCTAVGDAGFETTDILLTEKAGHWNSGVSYGHPESDISSVSCSSDGGCSAVGYSNAGETRGGSVFGEGLLLTKKRGKWRRVNVHWPNGGPGEAAALGSVSCASAGNCSAVGVFNVGIDYEIAPEGVLLTEKAGKWRRGVRARPPKNATSAYWGDYVDLAGISCASPGNCGAIGNYYTGDIYSEAHLTLLTEEAGKWRRGIEAALPRGAADPEGAAISCAAPGACTVVGSYSAGRHGFLLTEIAGSWARGVRPPHLPHSRDSVSSVSCTSPGDCGAVGVDWKPGGPVYGVLFDSTTDPCVVPKLKGKTSRTARHSIESHNCSVGTVKHAPSGTIEVGHVIAQRPHPGRHLAPGAKVNVKVSSGP